MATQTAIAKLHSPLQELVTAASSDGSSVLGQSEKDKAEVAEWIEKIASGSVTTAENLPGLDALLVPKTYIVSNIFTAADIALYGALHPVFSQLQPPQYYSHPALTRYFDHIQNQPSVRKAAESLSSAFTLVPLDIETAPKLERVPDAPKEKKKKAADVPVVVEKEETAPPAATNIALGKAQAQSQSQKKEKKEKKPAGDAAGASNKKGGGGGSKEAPDSGDPVPSMIDLRVGHILDIKVHPDADGLYIEQIDFGEESGPRQVVSGLVNYIPIEQMRDKYLVGVCNLKPANMRGVKSFAMVLCATHKDGKDAGIELVQPPPGSKVGDRIYFEGEDFQDATPLPQLNPKKKIFETVQPGFTTLDSKEAAWVNPATKSVHKIRTKDGVCVAPNFVGASLS